MKYIAAILIGIATLPLPVVQAHEPVLDARSPIQIPDPPGFVTLKCDFHIHTVFSDGLVWPTVRATEGWREGLDAIAITDHIEYQPHKSDITTNHNRSFEIARSAGSGLDLLVVKGSEITRKMPPGHLNAIFLTNSTSLAVSTWQDAIQAAHEQGAFIFWNHPGWEAQITNDQVIWYPEHTMLLEKGMLHGIEVVNGREYYPEAHRWALEKKLGMLSNSDVHAPLNMDYLPREGDHRPITLVFAKERTAAALKEALFARRTAVYSGEKLIGDEAFLKPIFQRSIRLNKQSVAIKGKQRVNVQISNDSDLTYQLERAAVLPDVTIPKKLVLPARKTVILALEGKSATTDGVKEIELPFNVRNLWIGPEQPLAVTLPLTVRFTAEK